MVKEVTHGSVGNNSGGKQPSPGSIAIYKKSHPKAAGGSLKEHMSGHKYDEHSKALGLHNKHRPKAAEGY